MMTSLLLFPLKIFNVRCVNGQSTMTITLLVMIFRRKNVPLDALSQKYLWPHLWAENPRGGVVDAAEGRPGPGAREPPPVVPGHGLQQPHTLLAGHRGGRHWKIFQYLRKIFGHGAITSVSLHSESQTLCVVTCLNLKHKIIFVINMSDY